MYKSRLLTAILLVCSVPAFAQETSVICTKSGKIKYLDEIPHKKISGAYCAERSKGFLLSDNCNDRRKCNVTQKRNLKDKPIGGPVGNPSHIRCRLAGGQPRVTEILVSEKWWPAGLCVFSDGSFAEIETWWSHWGK